MKILVLGRQHIAKSEDIIKGLQDLGHTVHYLLFPSLQYPQNYYTTHTGNISTLSYTSKIAYYWGHYHSIRKYMTSHLDTDYDYILAIDWFEGYIALSLRDYFKDIPIIYYAYDYYFYSNRLSSRYIINKIEASVYKRANMVWALSSQIIIEHEKKHINKSLVLTIPLGIHTQKIAPYKPDSRQILFMGNFKEGHNLRLLVNVFAKLSPDYHLHLIGKGNLYQEIEKIIQPASSNITLYGFQDEQQIQELVVKHHIGFGIALYENTLEISCADPGKIKDYLSLGLPIITTPYPSISKDIQEYNLGLVIQDNEESLYTTLIHIDENNMNKFAKNIIRYTQQHSYAKILAKALSQSK
jgi:glycosyltransferase involved in cell wall biosynthesis